LVSLYAFVDQTTTPNLTITGQTDDAATGVSFATISPDSIYMATTGNSVTLIAESAAPPHFDTLQALGNNDVLATNGNTNVSFVDNTAAGSNTTALIDATAATAHTFSDAVSNFVSGDSLILFGFKAPGAGPVTPPGMLPAGVTLTNVAGGADVKIDFAGGTTPTATIAFHNLAALQLQGDISTGTSARGIQFLLVHAS
jgi:hypothetical protein